tara:strand:+ start:275 stop:736 length:462 start_codon:yes stop_codon:yes gene_type:complete
MTLSSEVQLRISSKKLIELTNQDNLSATTLNTTVLNAAIADSKAEITDETNLVFDDTKAQHIRVGVIGVQAYLQSYTNSQTTAYESLRREFERAMVKLGKNLGAEKRLSPSSNNTTTPSTPLVGMRPEQDRTRWEAIVPRMPGGADQYDDGTI